MTTVHFSTIHKKWPYKRQTPGETMQWKDTRYVFNNNKAQSDILVVYDEPHQEFATTIPKQNRILFISEPPSIKNYSSEYLNQFGTIITPQYIDGLEKDTKQHISQLSLPWHYGVSHSHRFTDYDTYDSLKVMEPPTKIQEISTIISSKTMNAQHKKRIETTAFLKEKLNDCFHRLGRGFTEVDDKAEGITPYAFHLVCENNDIPNFWTEKLADAYLGYAFPLFSGCTNIGDYFPTDSYLQVDLTQPEKTLQVIEKLLNDPEFYPSRLEAIKKARDKILNDYNLFNVIHDIVTTLNLQERLRVTKIIKPQTPQLLLINRIVTKMITFAKKVINKGMTFVLPIYFKIINKNMGFITDYHDRLGKEATNKGYYGQRGQDWFISEKIFPNKRDGFFLDIGANDPKNLSNTLYFEENGWKGLAFEPQERFREKWKEQRSTECLPDLLGANDNETVTFIEYDTEEWQNALSGVEGYAHEQESNLKNLQKKRTILNKRKLANILKEKKISHIDFVSLDVEGFEMEVLKGIDFNAVHIETIIVENDRSHLGDIELRKFIKSKGYNHIARLSGDDIFTKR